MKRDEELISSEQLGRYLDDKLPGRGEFSVQRHVAGHSNETFFISRGTHEWVLRRPPLAVYQPTAHDVLREFRILDFLKDTKVRSPMPTLACDDETIIGAPFYIMERATGSVLRRDIPEEIDTPQQRRNIGCELVLALAELHQIDATTPELEGFGKPQGYLARQIKRWSGQLEIAQSLTKQSRAVPDLWAVRDWLAEKLPQTQRTTIVHGDYKLDNVVFSNDAPAKLTAILDWEMSTLGDPIADLGWMLSFWCEPDDGPEPLDTGLPSLTKADGFMSRNELMDVYQSATGTQVVGIGWYVVLAKWKLACLLEGSFGRHLGGTTDDPFFAQLEKGIPNLASETLEHALSGAQI